MCEVLCWDEVRVVQDRDQLERPLWSPPRASTKSLQKFPSLCQTWNGVASSDPENFLSSQDPDQILCFSSLKFYTTTRGPNTLHPTNWNDYTGKFFSPPQFCSISGYINSKTWPSSHKMTFYRAKSTFIITVQNH